MKRIISSSSGYFSRQCLHLSMFSIQSNIIPHKMLSTKTWDLWLDVVNDKNCLPPSQKAAASYKCLDHSGVSARRGFNVTTWWKCLHAGTNELLLCVVCWYNSHKVTKCQKTQEVHPTIQMFCLRDFILGAVGSSSKRISISVSSIHA